ncbi:hypothetical protein [Tenacibaculum sp. 190524A05c]|uniref:hypothetical protein n=1 Tax=Tenacibaculum platacis TaxID=3137852 RepID=UPI0032B177A4
MQQLSCPRCSKEKVFEVPFFGKDERDKLVKLKIKSSILLVKELIQSFKLSHSTSKFIAAHINKTNGKCHRCNYSSLDGKNIICPKCKSLNFNWN